MMEVTKLKEFSDAILDVCKSYYADIDAITAERDEWKRRCNQITYKLGNSPQPTEDGWRKWYQNMYASLKSIAEGRDNG